MLELRELSVTSNSDFASENWIVQAIKLLVLFKGVMSLHFELLQV